jgi:hypothetical protein
MMNAHELPVALVTLAENFSNVALKLLFRFFVILLFLLKESCNFNT